MASGTPNRSTRTDSMSDLPRSKINRVWVTKASSNDVGSFVVDEALKWKVGRRTSRGIGFFAADTGCRLRACFVPRGETPIHSLGGGAGLIIEGDNGIVVSFEDVGIPSKPRTIRVDQDNQLVEFLEGL